MHCSLCGETVPDGQTVCPKCGHDTAQVSRNTGPADASTQITPPSNAATAKTVPASSAPSKDTGRARAFIADRFELVRKLGEGGMGQVYQGYDHQLRRPVAIKRLLPSLSQHGPSTARFLVEAQAIAALNHPNVVQIYDIGEDKQGKYIVMEYVEGRSLADTMQVTGKLAPRDAIYLMLQIVRGLRLAHDRGVIHRDIKPGNVLIGQGSVPKLADFGLAQLAQSRDLTATGTAMGTWNYASPEQLADAKHVDQRSDLFSCGAMLYELVTGESPRHIHEKSVPEMLRPCVVKCLSPKPDDRYQNAAELLAALSDAYRTITTAPLPPSHGPSKPPPLPPPKLGSRSSVLPAGPDAIIWQIRRCWWSRPIRLAIGWGVFLLILMSSGEFLEGARSALAEEPDKQFAAAMAWFPWAMTAAVILAALAFAIAPIWSGLGTYYRLTATRLIVRRGLLFARETDYPLADIREGDVYRGFWGSLLGYGTVRFTRPGKLPLILQGVPNALYVKETVLCQALRR